MPTNCGNACPKGEKANGFSALYWVCTRETGHDGPHFGTSMGDGDDIISPETIGPHVSYRYAIWENGEVVSWKWNDVMYNEGYYPGGSGRPMTNGFKVVALF